jgi:hypothetical protein
MGTVTQFPTANEPEEVSLRIALHELGEGCGMDLTPEMPEIKPHVPALKALLKAYSEGFTVTINNLEEHQVEDVRCAIDEARRHLFAETFFNVLCEAGVMVRHK